MNDDKVLPILPDRTIYISDQVYLPPSQLFTYAKGYYSDMRKRFHIEIPKAAAEGMRSMSAFDSALVSILHNDNSVALLTPAMLKLRQERERILQNDYQECRRQNETVRKGLRGRLAITVSASDRAT